MLSTVHRCRGRPGGSAGLERQPSVFLARGVVFLPFLSTTNLSEPNSSSEEIAGFVMSSSLPGLEKHVIFDSPSLGGDILRAWGHARRHFDVKRERHDPTELSQTGRDKIRETKRKRSSGMGLTLHLIGWNLLEGHEGITAWVPAGLNGCMHCFAVSWEKRVDDVKTGKRIS